MSDIRPQGIGTATWHGHSNYQTFIQEHAKMQIVRAGWGGPVFGLGRTNNRSRRSGVLNWIFGSKGPIDPYYPTREGNPFWLYHTEEQIRRNINDKDSSGKYLYTEEEKGRQIQYYNDVNAATLAIMRQYRSGLNATAPSRATAPIVISEGPTKEQHIAEQVRQQSERAILPVRSATTQELKTP